MSASRRGLALAAPAIGPAPPGCAPQRTGPIQAGHSGVGRLQPATTGGNLSGAALPPSRG